MIDPRLLLLALVLVVVHVPLIYLAGYWDGWTTGRRWQVRDEVEIEDTEGGTV